jgi:ATP-dependent Lon protease
VRDLERRIGAIYRKMATRLAERQPFPDRVDGTDLDDLLGPPRFSSETLLGADEVGVMTGLAWTPAGGDVPEETRSQLEIVLVEHMDELLLHVPHPQAVAVGAGGDTRLGR